MTTFFAISNCDVNVIMHRFETVSVSLVGVVSMITEQLPGVVIFQHPIRAVARVIGIELQFAFRRWNCQYLLPVTTDPHSLDHPRDVLLQPRVRVPNSDR